MVFAKNMTGISAPFWYRKVVWLMDYRHDPGDERPRGYQERDCTKLGLSLDLQAPQKSFTHQNLQDLIRKPTRLLLKLSVELLSRGGSHVTERG